MMPLWLFYAFLASGLLLIVLGFVFGRVAPFAGIAIGLGLLLVVLPSVAVLVALGLYQAGLI